MQTEKIDLNYFGGWLFDKRVEHHLTRDGLAELSKLDTASLSQYELYGRLPRVDNFEKILNAFGYEMVIREKKDGVTN